MFEASNDPSIQKFCFATHGLKSLPPPSEEAKLIRQSHKDAKKAMIEEMVRKGVSHVPLVHGDDTVYVKLGKRTKAHPFTPETITSVLNGLSLVDLENERRAHPNETLPHLLTLGVQRAFKSKGESTNTIQFTSVPPKLVQQQDYVPSKTFVEAASLLGRGGERLRVIQKERREEMQPFKEEVKESEECVANHLKRMESGCQKVQIVTPSGQRKEYVLKRKEVEVTKRHTLRSGLPILQKCLSQVCSKLDLNDITSLRVLQRPSAMSQLERLLSDELNTKETRVSVRMLPQK